MSAVNFSLLYRQAQVDTSAAVSCVVAGYLSGRFFRMIEIPHADPVTAGLFCGIIPCVSRIIKITAQWSGVNQKSDLIDLILASSGAYLITSHLLKYPLNLTQTPLIMVGAIITLLVGNILFETGKSLCGYRSYN